MTDELQQQEAETLDTATEEVQATEDGEQVDYKAEAAKYKAIAERKSKQLEKVTSSLKEDGKELKKPNTQEGLTRDEVKLYAMGHNDEEVELAVKLAKLNGVTVSDAIKDDYFLAKIQERKQKEKSAKAQLNPARGGSPITADEPQDRSEHQKWYLEQMKKAGLS